MVFLFQRLRIRPPELQQIGRLDLIPAAETETLKDNEALRLLNGLRRENGKTELKVKG